MSKISEKVKRLLGLRKNHVQQPNYNMQSYQPQMDIQPRKCCLCGCPESKTVKIWITGSGEFENNFVCDGCARQIYGHVDSINQYQKRLEEQQEEALRMSIEIPYPHEIKAYLDDYVIGQDEAKIKLSVAVYNHYKRVYQHPDEVDIDKSNVICVGPSGSGKTLLVKTLAQMLDVPYTICDATVFTQAGYVGEDVESILSRVLQNANGDIKKAERSIVLLDEIDKIARKGDSPSITKDVSGEGVQQALLKLLEGSKVRVTPDGARKHPDKPTVEIDTKNILFICSGAFVGIERHIGKRMNKKAVGFSTDDNTAIKDENLLQYITADDIRAFGIIPELVGRLPVITHVNDLDKESLLRILTEPKNAIIKQYIKLFEMDNVKLSFEPECLDFIVDQAISMKVGARALRSVVEEIMTQYMYDIPSTRKKKLVVTREYAEEVIAKKSPVKKTSNIPSDEIKPLQIQSSEIVSPNTNNAV